MRLYLSSVVLVIAFLMCAPDANPYLDPSNVKVELLLSSAPDTGYAVEDTAHVGVALQLAFLVDSICVLAGGAWDTTLAVATTHERETLWVPVPLRVAPNDTVRVTVYIRDGRPERDSVVVQLRGGRPSIVTGLPPIAGTKEGGNCTLWVAAQGTPPLAYSWYKDSQILQGKVSDTLLLSNVRLADSGSYFCIVSNPDLGADTSTVVRVLVKPLGTPDPPTGLTISGQSDRDIRLTWNSAGSVDGYRVYRSAAAQSEASMLAQVSDTTYVLKHDSRSWYVWVCAVKNNLESFPSAVIKWELDSSVLYPPPHLTVVRKDSTSVALTWGSVIGADFYMIFRNANRNTAGYMQIASPQDTFFTDAVKYSYYYYVFAANDKDTSVTSDTVSATGSSQ